MPSDTFLDRLRQHRHVVCNFIRGLSPIWLLTEMHGNIGDQLIWAGTHKLLISGGVNFARVPMSDFSNRAGPRRQGTLVVPGSGAFTTRWHEWLPNLVRVASSIFDRVVVLPSEFEPAVPVVRDAISQPNVFPFARDAASYAKIKRFGRAVLAPDPALYAFEFANPAVNKRDDLGEVLLALRTDAGSTLEEQGVRPGPLNNDISLTTKNLKAFLAAIQRADTVVTDRLHVIVAAIMLGKQVQFINPACRKISRYVRYNFGGEFAERLHQRDVQWLACRGYVISKTGS